MVVFSCFDGHCDNLFEKVGAGYFAFRWFVTFVLSVLCCVLILLVSVIGKLCSGIVVLPGQPHYLSDRYNLDCLPWLIRTRF